MDRQRKNVTIALLLLAATIALTAAVILTGGDDILVAVLLCLIAAELLAIGRITDSRGDAPTLSVEAPKEAGSESPSA